MRYVVKILRDVGIYHLILSIPNVIAHIIHRLMGVPFGAESIGVLLKIRLKWLPLRVAPATPRVHPTVMTVFVRTGVSAFPF